jgi:hypothetical protein
MFPYSGLRYIEMDLFKLQQRALNFDCNYWNHSANKSIAQSPSATTFVKQHTTMTRQRDNHVKQKKERKRRVGSTHWYTTARQSTLASTPATEANLLSLRPDGKFTPSEHQ